MFLGGELDDSSRGQDPRKWYTGKYVDMKIQLETNQAIQTVIAKYLKDNIQSHVYRLMSFLSLNS